MNLWQRIQLLFGKKRFERELDDELSFHLDAQMETNLRAGMSPDEARRQALLELGGVEQVKERVRQTRPGFFLETLWQDVRFGARMLRKNPGFTAVAVLTLALGIGATTAIFTVVNAVLLRPLPYAQPERLVLISTENSRRGWTNTPLPPGAYWEFQEQSRTLEGLAVFRHRTFTLTGGDEPRRIAAAAVTASFFPVLGVQPQRGRAFLPEEDLPGGRSVCIISHGLWQRHFGGTPNVVGQTLRLEGNPCEVTGIMPASFNFPEKSTDIWLPLQLPPGERVWRRWSLTGVARLMGQTPRTQAQAEVDTVAKSFADHLPLGAGWRFVLTSLNDKMVGPLRTALWVLFGTTGFVLLIASLNLASLLLARMHTRSRELAVRSALGAGRARLLRQVLSENGLLALLGAGLGVAVAVWVVDVFRWLAPADFPRVDEIAVDGGALGFTLAASLVTVFLAGLIPARQVTRRGLAEGLREAIGARGILGGRTHMRSALVATEVGLAVVLLLGAGLLLRSLHQLMSVEVGVAAENVLTMSIQLPPRYGDSARFTFFEDLQQRIRALPGVLAVGLTTGLPTRGVMYMDSLTIEGAPPVDPNDRPKVALDVASPGYFRATGIPLLEGELFTQQGIAVPRGIVVNEAITRRYFPGESAVGRRVLGSDDKTWLLITGVVGSVKQFGPRKETPLQIYMPHQQPGVENAHVVVRMAADPAGHIADIKGVVRSLDPDLPVVHMQTMRELLSASVAEPRFTTVLMATFATLALVLAVVGIYGVVAYATSRRVQEIGVRLALGAQPVQITRLVIRQGIRPAVTGLVVGVAAALGLTRFLRSLLFEISPTDPATFAAAAAVLAVVSVLACYIPARRASKVDPMVALRYE